MKKVIVLTIGSILFFFGSLIGQEKSKCAANPESKWDIPPEVIKNSPIKYPEDALKENIQGTVYLKVMINSTGKVTSTEIIKKDSVTESMEKEAQNAVSQYIFKPAKYKGKNVNAIITLPIRFKLQ